MLEPRWKIGVELELLAPPGRTRRDLAELLAERAGGSVRAVFHPQSEPSKVPGQPVFQNLTLGFEAVDADGALIARCVDDLTLQADLDRQRAPRPGWCRVVSDDVRLLRILARQLEPADVIEPGARLAEVAGSLFGAAPVHADGLVRLVDAERSPIAIVARLPGERERPCELVTPPIEGGLGERLASLVGVAVEAGFTVASEAATHLHFDASRLRSTDAVANLVALIVSHRDTLRELLGHNPRWQRTGAWSSALVSRILSSSFRGSDWEASRAELMRLEPTKYCDFNLKNLIFDRADCHTVEARTIPGTLDVERIVQAAVLFEAILERACQATPVAPRPASGPGAVRALFDLIALPDEARRYWQPGGGGSRGRRRRRR